jgi:hypothetical protein
LTAPARGAVVRAQAGTKERRLARTKELSKRRRAIDDVATFSPAEVCERI